MKINPKITIIALSVIALALTATTFAALTVDQNVQSTGIITVVNPSPTPSPPPPTITPTPTPSPAPTASPAPTTEPTLTPTPTPTIAPTPTPPSSIDVYSDSDCTQSIDSIDWGSIEAGASTTKTIYLKYTGTETITLDLTVNNWTPTEAGSYINITWDATGTQLNDGQSVATVLTLSVDSTITDITEFSNTIIISGNM